MKVELKSGYDWEYLEADKVVRITRRGVPSSVVCIPRIKARSLLCFLNRVAWHRSKKGKNGKV